MGTSQATVEIHLDDTLMKLENSRVLESMELLGLDGRRFTLKLIDDLGSLRRANSRAGSDDEEYENFANFALGIADSLDRFIGGVSTQSASSDSDAVNREMACIEADVKQCMEMASRLGL